MSAWKELQLGSTPPSSGDGPLSDPAVGEVLAASTMTLATAGPGGRPHAAPVFFAVGDDLALCFLSRADSRHLADLAEDPRAAAAVHLEAATWRSIAGIQLEGSVVAALQEPMRERAWTVYRDKFPFVSELDEQMSHAELHLLRPDWLRLIDNRRGFAFRREWRRASV